MSDRTPSQPRQETNPDNPLRLNIAIAGTGKGLAPLAELLSSYEFAQSFVRIRLTGLLHTGHAELPHHIKQVPRYANVAELLQQQPDTTALADLSDSGEHMQSLREQAPQHISIMNADTVMAIFRITTSEQRCQSCHIHLTHARTLFSTLIDQIDEDILLLDSEGRIADMNKNVLDRCGGTKLDWLGKYCCDLEGKDFCSTCQGACPFQETLRTGAKAEQIHSRVTPDGKLSYHRVYTYPVFDQYGELAHLIEMRRDITSRTDMERKLQQAEKMAAIGELSTYIAHEIRNPLFAIGGFAKSLLRNASLDDNAREKVRIILEESKRLDGILRNTMNFAKPSDPRRGDVDLNHIVRETISLMRINDKQRKLITVVELADNLPLARGDSDMAKQCLINLVKNSQEAMTTGGTLTVSTGMKQRGLYIQVQDTGPGIPQDIQENIFSPFFSTKNKGAGLGLAMTKKLIEEMGGTVVLESSPETGTCITLFLQPLLAA